MISSRVLLHAPRFSDHSSHSSHPWILSLWGLSREHLCVRLAEFFKCFEAFHCGSTYISIKIAIPKRLCLARCCFPQAIRQTCDLHDVFSHEGALLELFFIINKLLLYMIVGCYFRMSFDITLNFICIFAAMQILLLVCVRASPMYLKLP